MSTAGKPTLNPLKYILIGNSNTVQMITEFVNVKSTQTQAEAKQIFEKLCKSGDKRTDERNKIQGKQGNYYFTISAPNIFYLILADASYPERLIFQLIDCANKDHIPLLVNDTGELNANGRQMLKTLVDQYQDEKNFSKISEIQSDVDDIKIDLNQNIKKLVTNLDDVKNLEDRSNKIKLNAKDYKTNAHELERVTWCQNAKLTLIIIGAAVLVFLIIFLPIILK
jgi:vesicle-associated membrane protein 7